MTTLAHTTQQTAHWLARGISAIAAAFWLLILLDILACDALVGFICINWELALLAGLTAFSMLCVMIAWHNESIGGFVMIIWGLAFTIIACATSRNYLFISVLVSGVPFLIAGGLFLMSWRLSNTSMGLSL